MNTLVVALLVAALSLDPAPKSGSDLTGRVVAVHDGDTLTLEVPSTDLAQGSGVASSSTIALSQAEVPGAPVAVEHFKVRLNRVDAPELRQPFGCDARDVLASLVKNQEVHVHVDANDRYGRAVARVSLGTLDVNAELVRRGAAWVYRQYSKDPALLRLETEAREAKRGLWALPADEQVPPWVFRHKARQVTQPAP